ncbi:MULTISPECIES: cation diffusion facilitator family transporter [Deinococcus]|jgi:cobalt-zinc-cadmium efflux system protein|uniref:Cobalt-zinc-cadmium efflux system protein n=4 Tax=Deinococcus TaxID=1298 RepID=A0ACC6KNX6_9DEIO|nr:MULTISPECIES: cation diffusion facilitator family transporter [Deinococcus]MDK2013697.1 cation diffusion facilitator family transporter [Deinococcus sp. 43]MDR6221002.1 cobalt-zinc-cadmium efflux system protein [Deinococcus soli (ex Cha et al. 2016)]MDR6331258.1 cobalt-zinc-cadmium efflux system protein [Deinococcus soli (ex Cha et al. 2016)]MDR6754160.1 cobalt-zinc-cadmium efflux system protein [Deinococcus soli (ex Cha et al. 2016)]RIY15434.1 cation transporter [Deinococcus sp. RM]
MSDHGHSHGAAANARQLTLALLLTGSFLVVEVIYGLLSGSLALLSDAGHMLTDVMALALSLFALKIGQRTADRRLTFGYRRAEILAAAVNAAALFAIGLYILVEAYGRLRAPVEVQTTPMLIVATLGLVVNLISARLLVQGSGDSLNMKSAYLEVMGDLLGSVAVIVGALLIRFTGQTWIDPVLGALIGLWVLPRTWQLLKASVNVLMEGVPSGLDLDALRAELAALPGITDVHDLHVWSVTSGQHSLTAHLVSPAPSADVHALISTVATRHGIEHVTVQLEAPGAHDSTQTHLHP